MTTPTLQDRLRKASPDMGCYAALALRKAAADRLDEQDKRIAELEAEIHDWKTWGVIEVAIRNPSVSEWMKHWEGRCLKAEQEVARLSSHIRAIAEHHDKAAGQVATVKRIVYHTERRDFALSIFATPTKGEMK